MFQLDNELLDVLVPSRTLRVQRQDCPWLSNSTLHVVYTILFNGLTSSLGTKPGKFWRHFRCLSRRTKDVNGNTQLSVTAYDFNNHFLAIPYKTVAYVTSTVPATEFLDRLFGDRIVPPLEFSYIDSEIVSSVVSGLDFHKATGSDGLSTRFIRASPHMVRLITILFNKCISNSLVPYQWKQMTPVLKCKQCTALSQFQPISVLPILSKVLEWTM